MQWCRLTLLIFLCYNLLWIPVMAEEENFTWTQTVNSIILDLVACAIISFINCMVLAVLRRRLEITEWTENHSHNNRNSAFQHGCMFPLISG